MNLDLHTMMSMISVLTLLLSGLLALAGLHAGRIRGVRLWALASLCYSLASFIAFANLTPMSSGWLFLLGVVLVMAGSGLQFSGIQAFKEERIDWRIPLLVVGVAFAQSVWFTLLHPDANARAIANSLVFAVINASCARALLIRIEPPLRTAYWFTGASFAVLSAASLVRAATIFQTPSGTFVGLASQLPFVPVRFLASSLILMCVTFGFILMLNYRLIADMQKIALRDGLTGALNRRSLEEEAARLRARCIRTGDKLAIMMIDVDHFKLINDRCGHQVGDKVLQHLVAVAQAAIRSDDYFARYGGEEFCILLPSTTEEEARVLADRLRQTYAALTMEFGGEVVHSTISIGVADSNHVGLEFNALVTAADQAMYWAKQEGRNRVVTHSGMVCNVSEMATA
ncbi:GGDEF domain-containing protein [Sulfuriferula sp.]|uniref:GGDEF domain-containing protein n=1 Tax=Sulfuriferula sp. TaxID=2025307 RepID=UPI0027310B8E|nr:GGDEF domain-containing protein [Sulfuriferula sp.]MDP2027987.1 GGDEF domain-containing protein [Sulfuriferula sp.]